MLALHRPQVLLGVTQQLAEPVKPLLICRRGMTGHTCAHRVPELTPHGSRDHFETPPVRAVRPKVSNRGFRALVEPLEHVMGMQVDHHRGVVVPCALGQLGNAQASRQPLWTLMTLVVRLPIIQPFPNAIPTLVHAAHLLECTGAASSSKRVYPAQMTHLAGVAQACQFHLRRGFASPLAGDLSARGRAPFIAQKCQRAPIWVVLENNSGHLTPLSAAWLPLFVLFPRLHRRGRSLCSVTGLVLESRG
jgi:hypothetical protein